jgi:hypothetical protein
MHNARNPLALIALATLVGCGGSTSPPSSQLNGDPEPDGKVFITDQTGKEWDITYAVRELGFEPGRFNFGLGPNAILPILEPEFWFPGDVGYPSPTSSLQVLGVTLDGESKAYPVGTVARHEVVNDFLASRPIAVAY